MRASCAPRSIFLLLTLFLMAGVWSRGADLNDLTETTDPGAGSILHIYDPTIASGLKDRKITPANLRTEMGLSTIAAAESLWGSINIIVATEIDTLAELEALMGAVNIIASTEIDSMAELEALAGAVNILLETEIDSSAELRAIMDDETGTGALVFAGGDIGAATATTPSADDNSTKVATTAYVQTELAASEAARDTIAELETLLGVDIIIKTEIDTEAEFESLLFTLPEGGGGGGIDTTAIDTSAELLSILTDETGTGSLVFQHGNVGSATAATPTSGDSSSRVANTSWVMGERGSTLQAWDTLLDGISDLSDPDADKVLGWNDSASGFAWYDNNGSSAPSGTMVFTAPAPELYALPMASDLTGTNYVATNIKSSSDGNDLSVPGEVIADRFRSQSSEPFLLQLDLGGTFTNAANDVRLTNDIPYLFRSNVTHEGSVSLGSSATASTPSAGDNDTSLATTAFVQTTAKMTMTGTHASPSTTNPLTPTWDAQAHTVWYGATGEIDLPAAASYTGRGILIYNTGAFTITIDPNGSEVIVRDGTVQTGGVTFTLSSGAGNYVALLSDGARWVTLGYKGTLTEGS
jgi:hypothetical protein